MTENPKLPPQVDHPNAGIPGGSRLIIGTGIAMVDYLKCLDAMGVGVRLHQYLGPQINVQGLWQIANSDVWYEIYLRVCNECTILKPNNKREKPNYTRAVRDDAIKALLATNKRNPLKDYFVGLKAQPWEDASKLLEMAFNLDLDRLDTDLESMETYFRDVSLLIGKGLFWRTMQPGSNFPFFPILVGGQGIGKSYFLQCLLPPKIAAEVYLSSFDMSLDAKERAILIQSAALIEASEMSGHGKRDIATNKAFISSNSTKVRRPYSAFVEQLLRHDIIIGTTNEETCLPIDPSGDRRHIIIPVMCKRIRGQRVSPAHYIPELMFTVRDRYWGHIKWLYNKNSECSYELWDPVSIRVREQLVSFAERRTYPLEEAINDLLARMVVVDGKAPKNIHELRYEDFQKKRMTDDEIENGIPLNVPPTMNMRSIMNLLPKEITSRYSSEFVGRTVKRMGWKNKRKTVKGHKLSFKIPPTVS